METEMKLSDAIEAGWKLAPQSWRDGWGQTDEAGNWRGVCAVGAAILGAKPDVDIMDMHMETAVELFPRLTDSVADEDVPDKLYGHEYLDVGDVIQFMNDVDNRPGTEIVAYLRRLGY